MPRVWPNLQTEHDSSQMPLQLQYLLRSQEYFIEINQQLQPYCEHNLNKIHISLLYIFLNI